MILAFLGVLGACVGSFLNVVAYRLPRECMSVTRPRSRCPRCASRIPWFANLPVLSWVLLGGRCRSCKAAISPRYPLVELGTGFLFVLLALLVVPPRALGFPADHAQVWLDYGVMALVTAALVALTLIDLDHRILPDEITKSGIVLGPFLAALAPSVQPAASVPILEFGWLAGERWQAFGNGVVGALVAGGVLGLIAWGGARIYKKEAMGLGDVKMIAAMGAVLGVWALLALVVASMAGAIVGITIRIVTKERYIPFGPFLALGMWVVMVRGCELVRLWIGSGRWGC